MSKKKQVIAILIIVLTLVISIVGATYAYFSVTITGNENASTIITNAGDLSLLYQGGNEINASGVIPGWNTQKGFTVTNTGTVAVDYNIIWSELLNEIQNGDLVYNVEFVSFASMEELESLQTPPTMTEVLAETTMPTAAGEILTDIIIQPGEVHGYMLNLNFLNKSTDQSINQGKTFAGKIEINTEYMENGREIVYFRNNNMHSSDFFDGPIQKEQIEELEFVDHKTIPNTAIGSWDISNTSHISTEAEDVIVWYEPIGSNGRYKVTIGSDKIMTPHRGGSLFSGLINLNKLELNSNLSFSGVTDMSHMFSRTGYNNANFTLNLGNKFDTSSVTNMQGMFNQTGYNSANFVLNLGNKFDTSKVTSARGMFYETGYSSNIFTLNLMNKFDTSNVTDMQEMFFRTGYNNHDFKLNLGDKFDTSSVIDMRRMFYETGYSNTDFELNLGNEFNTSKVTDMAQIFCRTGYANPTFMETLNLGNKFITSQIAEFKNYFYYDEETGVNYYCNEGVGA